jgi:hypothetical protein
MQRTGEQIAVPPRAFDTSEAGIGEPACVHCSVRRWRMQLIVCSARVDGQEVSMPVRTAVQMDVLTVCDAGGCYNNCDGAKH